MKINEILIESQLQEGPLLNKLGSAIGKGVGTLAKGVGAVAGGIAGIGSAVKKGYQAGKAQVGAAGDDAPSPAAGPGTTATGSAPAAKPAAGSTAGAAKPGTQTLANPKDPNTGTTPAAAAGQDGAAGAAGKPGAAGAAGQDGAAGAAGKPGAAGAAGQDGAAGAAGQDGAAGAAGQDGAAGAAGKPGTPKTKPQPVAAGPADSQGRIEPKMGSTASANDTQYAQAQKAIAALQPEDQKQILAALQSDPKVKSSLSQQTTKQPVAQTGTTKGAPGKPTFTGVPKKNPTPKGEPPSATPAAEPALTKTKGRKKPAAPSQAEIDADRERLIGPTSDSIIRRGRSIVEHIDEAGLMAKLGTKVGQAAQAVGKTAGKAVGTVQQAVPDADHAKALVKAFNTGNTSADPNSRPPIQDSSGTVPRPIIDKINQLNLEQRAELHKLITQKTL